MIFYFTGTGNSLYAAKMLGRSCISIPRIINNADLTFEAPSIGIVCPIYGHEMPAMVKDFIRRAEFRTDYSYVVLTYGNRHANAVELADAVFENAGKKADYITTLLTVDNFLPAFDMNAETRLDKGTEKQLADIKADIEAKKHGRQRVTEADRAAHNSYIGLVGHQPETVWANFDFTDRCVGCGICSKVCPARCISIENQKATRSEENCQACFACVQACPTAAIKMKTILGFAEKNPEARYRNEHIELAEIIAANGQSRR